jgi:alpha-tubulin suppressor-like RCC1 family protein
LRVYSWGSQHFGQLGLGVENGYGVTK